MRISKSFLGRALALESSLTRNPNVLETWTVFLHKYNSTSLHVHHLQPGYLHELPCQCSTAPGNIFSIKQPCFIYISFTFHLQCRIRRRQLYIATMRRAESSLATFQWEGTVQSGTAATTLMTWAPTETKWDDGDEHANKTRLNESDLLLLWRCRARTSWSWGVESMKTVVTLSQRTVEATLTRVGLVPIVWASKFKGCTDLLKVQVLQDSLFS